MRQLILITLFNSIIKIYKNKDKNKIISYISNKANDLFNIDITMKPILDELQNNKYQ